MKVHKGYLFDYAATGENWHLYVWKGKKSDKFHDWLKHVIIKEGDSFELIKPKTKQTYIMHYWTYDPDFIKTAKFKNILETAMIENWKINLVSWSGNDD